MIALYARHCVRTEEEVERTLERDHYLTPEEARTWGLIDQVQSQRTPEADGGL